MKLTEKVFDRIAHVARHYSRIQDRFASFLKETEYLTKSSSPIKGLSINASLEDNYFDVLFAGMTIRFSLLVTYSSDGVSSGRVVVVRVSPVFSDKKDIIGSFTFNGQGITDFESADDNDKLDIGYNASEIVLHFIDQAIAKPLA